MDEIPRYLLNRKRRNPLSVDSPSGEKSEDGDFKQLKIVREEYRAGKRLSSIVSNSDVLPVVIKKVKSEAAPNRTSRKLPHLDEKQEAERARLFDAAIKGDAVELATIVDSIQRSIVISDLVDPNNGHMNVLNYAVEHGMQDSVKYLIEKGDDDLILHGFVVPDLQTSRTALHQITISKDYNPKQKVDIASCLLSKTKSKQKVLTAETKFKVEGQRERTFPCLHLAALLNQEELVRLFTEVGSAAGVSVNHLNSKKDTAILWAARDGHDAIVKYLLENNANPNLGNDKHSTALHWAVRYERLSTVKLLVSSDKTAVNTVRALGLFTPLIMACAYGFLDIVKVLIGHGADVNFRAPGGAVPIHLAAKEGHITVVKELLKSKADVTIEDEKGDCAIAIAAREGHAQIVLTLLHWMDDPYHKNHMGHDAWYYAINTEDDTVLKVLLDYYTLNPEITTDSDGNVFQNKSPLFAAASLGKCEKIDYILKSGIRSDTKDLEGNGFLHYAAMSDQAEVIIKFHAIGDVNDVNSRNETCLHRAVLHGKTKSIHALIKVKARTDLKNKAGKNVLHVAARSSNTTPEIARELVAHTIQAHSWDVVNAVDSCENNALHIAAKYATPEVLWEFRRVSCKMKNAKGNTPFHRSIRRDQPEVLETMLDIFEGLQREGNINEQNNKGETVLHLAVVAGYSDTVRRLIYLRANLEATDNNGDTPLHLLAKHLVSSDNNISHQHACLATLDAIIYECPRWFCYTSTFKSQGYAFHSEDAVLVYRYRRQAVTWLFHKLTNKDNLSVFTLCFAIGAHDILSKVLLLEGIKYFPHEGFHYNDLTDVTPLTNGSLATKYFNTGTNKVTAKICGLELLGTSSEPARAAKVLDIIPMKYLETIYGRLNLITFTCLLFLHVIYMLIFSFTGIEISELFQNSNVTLSPSGLMIVAVYVVVPIEPLILLIFCIVSFASAVSRRDFKDPVTSFLPYLFYLVYSGLVIAWIVLASMSVRYQDYILALCLCCGWLYTIVLTRGLSRIHFFSRMIKYMVIHDIMRFLVIYLIVLLAFSFSLHVVFQISPAVTSNYGTVGESFFLVFNMMLGMGELFDDNFESGMQDVGRNTVFAKILFVVYVVLASIILLNMLIAMMNDSYNTMSQDQEISWRIDSIQLGVHIERLLPLSRHLFQSLGVELMEIPGEKKGFKVKDNVVYKYFLKMKRNRKALRQKLTHPNREQNEKTFAVLTDQISELTSKVQTSKNAIEENKQKFAALEKKLDAVLKLLHKDKD